MTRTIRNNYNSMHQAGGYLVSGLVGGINENSYKATNAARTMANNVANATRKALDIHSPSRVFENIGMFVDEGLAKGILRFANVATNATTTVSSNIVDNMRSAINSIVFDDIDTNPTIRPVIDLTDLKKGTYAMNSLLGTRTLDVTTNVTNARRVSTGMQSRDVVDNSDVVNAIDGLRKTLSGKVGNTYNSIGGITYDDGSNVTTAIKEIVRAAKMERRT